MPEGHCEQQSEGLYCHSRPSQEQPMQAEEHLPAADTTHTTQERMKHSMHACSKHVTHAGTTVLSDSQESGPLDWPLHTCRQHQPLMTAQPHSRVLVCVLHTDMHVSPHSMIASSPVKPALTHSCSPPLPTSLAALVRKRLYSCRKWSHQPPVCHEYH